MSSTTFRISLIILAFTVAIGGLFVSIPPASAAQNPMTVWYSVFGGIVLSLGMLLSILLLVRNLFSNK